MIFKLEHISYKYVGGSNNETLALDDINLTIGEDEFIGIIGQTGSGKSTLVQHLNGLEIATEGKIYCDDKCIYDKDFDMRALRCKVGLVFQYPEHQLFESTVFEDVCFGPNNLGLTKEQVEASAKKALTDVGVDEQLWNKSPFELSGGQKRKVAIAGILAMEPEVLILDEPASGLDPKGRDKILDLILSIKEQRHITVIVVSHSMEDMAKYASRLIVMNNGRILLDDTPVNVFKNYEKLEETGLCAPKVTYLMNKLSERGMPVDKNTIIVDEAIKQLYELLK